MSAHIGTEWTDDQMLMALHLRDHEGLTGQAIADRTGRSRSAICGMFNRIDRQIAKHDPDRVQDGTMTPLWWRR